MSGLGRYWRGGERPASGSGSLTGTTSRTQGRRLLLGRLRSSFCALLLLLTLGAMGSATVNAAGTHTAQGVRATLPAHALPVKEEPAENAVLKAPPGQVCIWFSEPLNTATSHIVVVDPTNHEVDKGDSHVTGGNSTAMCVTMQLVPAGTYVVAWRTQSAVDGHVVGGSYIFQVARPDGSVPAVPSKLPTGHFPGAGGTTSGTGGSLDPPTALQAIGNWLAYVFLAFWLGGLIWETWILSPNGHEDPDLDAASRRATSRFFQLAPYALLGVLFSDVLIVLGETSELAGGFGGMFDPSLLHAVLFGSQFGTFWWCREIVALVSLGLLALGARRDWTRWHGNAAAPAGAPIEAASAGTVDEATGEALAIPDWRREFAQVWRGVPRIPQRLVRGTRIRSRFGQVELLLGVALLVAFALSGHAAAVQASELPYVLSVDILHLIATATWVGGLLYISLVFVPTLAELTLRQRARILALGLPEFSALAIVSAVLLAVTGILNTTVHMTSIGQFLSTTYGRILGVKIELFLLMVAISFFHAFILRPRLVLALAPAATPSVATQSREGETFETLVELADDVPASARTGALTVAGTRGGDPRALPGGVARPSHSGDGPLPPRAPHSSSTNAASLSHRMENWMRREAWLGLGVLLCVALLAAFAGTLATTPASASGGNSGPYTATQTAGNYSVHMQISPDTFGTNTFTVALTDIQSKTPVTGAAVIIQTNMLDMDMGTQSVQLQPVDGTPGSYAGTSELTMAGNWSVLVKILPPNSQTFVKTSFKFFAGQG